MSVTGKRGVGVPVILMHDGEGTIVTVECKNGDLYRGFLDETEDNFNAVLKDATKTTADGKRVQIDHIFIRGSQICFFVFPTMLKKAPMFKRVKVRWACCCDVTFLAGVAQAPRQRKGRRRTGAGRRHHTQGHGTPAPAQVLRPPAPEVTTSSFFKYNKMARSCF
mmetsp:Transcript_20836/g.67107  ORF Transcript_20836/g.67107 Transcript_20836/m.67107 type:complete len:165 (+) Transcript_20836:94-588(+)